ncbi:hypothetical protein [Pimelobacter sp. 30-1]|uniref:hypothetical protein n=1 Tax=Pimelobacter sp. 30-1 TaxID=2004991 RepID=UPI001C053FA9|nr:hypothetical protein [Pimelobacter sp. 30-1]MBU2696018.1 hypothetical protein [Pimelobacter sp. 30-1]
MRLPVPALTVAALAMLLLLAGCADEGPGSPSTATAAPSSVPPTALTPTAPPAPTTPTAPAAAPPEATTSALGEVDPPTPPDLADRLRSGGLVVVHRYTGAFVPDRPDAAPEGLIDDRQRITDESTRAMQRLGRAYERIGVRVGTVLASEYYFVVQHARAAFGDRVRTDRDLTGSLYFDDQDELAASLQGLRNRVVAPPAPGQTTVLFTHQGKFEKAFGYYLDAGRTLVFEPDGSGAPRLVANLSLEDFLAL